MNKKVNILDIPFTNTTFNEFKTSLYHRINNHQRTFVVTANPEIAMYAYQNTKYHDIISAADFIVADGIGIVMGSKLLKTPIKERITGFDLFTDLLKWANQNHKSVYFLGAKPEVIQKLNQILITEYPNIVIAGIQDGYFKDEDPIVKEISLSQPDIVFVATGYPKQEEFIYRHQVVSNSLWMGIGGSFDAITQTVKRAPQNWQKMHLEWLYRVIKEPKRISRMTFIPKYLLAITKQKFNRK